MSERLTLEELEELRHCEPRRAAELALEAAAGADDEERLALLGIYGSCQRKLAKLDEAHNVLSHGLRIALRRGDRSACGDFRQRLGYVFADRGELRLALKAADRAIIDHTLARDSVGRAKALVDRGFWLYHLDRIDEAIECQKAALIDLPDSVPRSKYSALVALGHYYRKLGDLDEADRYAALAVEPAEELGLAPRGHLIWLRAEIAEGRGKLAPAQSLYAETVRIYRSLETPLDAGLAAVQLVRLLYRQRRFDEAVTTATSIAWLLEPLKRNRVASATIVDLIVKSDAGKLTLGLIDSAIQEIKRARTHHKRRVCSKFKS